METKSLKSKVVAFVKENKGVFIFLAVAIVAAAIYLAWRNRAKLGAWMKGSYGSLSDKLDKTLTKLEG